VTVSITKPTVGGSVGAWGTQLNAALDALTTAMNELLPDGGVRIFTRTSDPSSAATDGDIWLAPLP
jgi:hypothetical protein